jgi:hypothetical protein
MWQATFLLGLLAVLLGQQFGVRFETVLRAQQAGAASSEASDLDYEFFRDRVQPIFLNQREGSARCYTCHGQRAAGTFRLQLLSQGSTSWTEEQSRLNFESARALVVPGEPLQSPLLKHPLAAQAGGDLWHGGGQQFDSQDHPEWQTLAAWVNGQQ